MSVHLISAGVGDALIRSSVRRCLLRNGTIPGQFVIVGQAFDYAEILSLAISSGNERSEQIRPAGS